MTLYEINAWIMLVSLILYVLLGGADFGAGVWDLCATGNRQRRRAMRLRIGEAIGPIWEANHVWLILVVVLMFTCFPRAFAAMMTALHVPLTLVLIGIVMRGSAFVFRKYTPLRQFKTRRRWGLVFSVASIITPVLLGVSLATAATGDLQWDERSVYISGFFQPWLQIFPWSVGLFALAIFAYLAAVYFCAELASENDREQSNEVLSAMTTDDLLKAFRIRALIAAILVGIAAGTTWLLALQAAPLLSDELAKSWWTIPLQIATGLAAIGAIVALWFRWFLLARACAVAQVTLIMLGYGAATFPHLVVSQFTLENSAAGRETQLLVVIAIGCGALILLPSLWYLYRVFKGGEVFAIVD